MLYHYTNMILVFISCLYVHRSSDVYSMYIIYLYNRQKLAQKEAGVFMCPKTLWARIPSQKYIHGKNRKTDP